MKITYSRYSYAAGDSEVQHADALPCPFCGSEFVDLERYNAYYVQCRCCKANGAPDLTAYGAIEKWNTRKS